MQFPKMMRVRQTFDNREVDDIGAEVKAGMATLELASDVKPGQTVAVACSSRGITNYSAIVTAVVASLKALQLEPFIIPGHGQPWCGHGRRPGTGAGPSGHHRSFGGGACAVIS